MAKKIKWNNASNANQSSILHALKMPNLKRNMSVSGAKPAINSQPNQPEWKENVKKKINKSIKHSSKK